MTPRKSLTAGAAAKIKRSVKRRIRRRVRRTLAARGLQAESQRLHVDTECPVCGCCQITECQSGECSLSGCPCAADPDLLAG